MVATLLKIGGVGGLVIWATSHPSAAIQYSHIAVLLGATILTILYGLGFKGNLKYVAALLLLNVVIRIFLGGYWGVPAIGKITQGYNVFNHGVDIAIPEGTEVKAVRDGKVEKVILGDKIYGNYVILSHEDGLQTLYAHNNKLTIKEGDSVSSGETIALSGSTGNSTGPHLHFEIRKDGKTVDPFKYISFEGVQGK